MQTIHTYYLGHTNHRPARVVAVNNGSHRNHCKQLTVGRDGLPSDDKEAHATVAKRLAETLGWADTMIGGHLRDGSMIWVIDAPCSPRFTPEKPNG